MMTSAVPKLGAVVMMAFSMLFAASPSVASSTVAIPRTVSATSPCGSGPVTIPATHVPSSGLVEVDVGTHQRFHPIRVMPLDNPQAAIFAGGDLYVSYSPSGPESGFRVERIDPKTDVLARSQWFLGYSSPPVAAFGSIWVVAGRAVRTGSSDSAETLAVTMRTPIPPTFSPPSLAADDGALWFGASSARLPRLNPHTGRFSTVVLPEMAPDSQVVGITSGSSSDYLYVSVINQNAAHSQVIERFDPTTGSFFVVPTPPFELTACSALPETSSGSFKAGA